MKIFCSTSILSHSPTGGQFTLVTSACVLTKYGSKMPRVDALFRHLPHRNKLGLCLTAIQLPALQLM